MRARPAPWAQGGDSRGWPSLQVGEKDRHPPNLGVQELGPGLRRGPCKSGHFSSSLLRVAMLLAWVSVWQAHVHCAQGTGSGWKERWPPQASGPHSGSSLSAREAGGPGPAERGAGDRQGPLGRQESGQRIGTRPRVGKHTYTQRTETHHWGSRSRGSGLVVVAEVLSAQAGGVGRAPGHRECASLPSTLDTVMMAQGVGGRRGTCVDPSLSPIQGTLPGPQAPSTTDVNVLACISSQTKLIWINRGLPFLPRWVFCGCPSSAAPGGLGTH